MRIPLYLCSLVMISTHVEVCSWTFPSLAPVPSPPTVNSRILVQEIKQHQLDRIIVSADLRQITSLLKNREETQVTPAHPLITSKILEQAFENNVLVEFQPDPLFMFHTLNSVLQPLLLVPLFYAGYVVLTAVSKLASRGMTMQRHGHTNSSSTLLSSLPFSGMREPEAIEIQSVRLEDWAGSPEVKRECSEIVSYLRDRQRYLGMGAKIPKGVLLDGPPGTGKTLLAKAIACESQANFISISGSEFVEMYVGLGAARVRELFRDARKSKPTIVFIDEIDAVGRQRGTGINMGNDEREQTLNQLLAEMDGFKDNDEIIVLAATNRRDVLDAALLRPGRFDRLVTVPLPDYPSRLQILELYAMYKNLDRQQVNLKTLAQQTTGYSGAALENLLNEAALIAVRRNETIISKQSVNQALERQWVGILKEHDTRSIDTKRRIAIHESGHAVMAFLYGEHFDFIKVTIQNTYNGAGGYTIFNDKTEVSENGLYTKDYLKKRLQVLLGGRAAESLVYGEDFVTVGAQEDLRQAALLSRSMITKYGMGTQLENYCNPYENEDTPFIGRTLGAGHTVSEDLSALVDKEAQHLIREAYQQTRKVLLEYEGSMKCITDDLMEKNTLYEDDMKHYFRTT